MELWTSRRHGYWRNCKLLSFCEILFLFRKHVRRLRFPMNKNENVLRISPKKTRKPPVPTRRAQPLAFLCTAPSSPHLRDQREREASFTSRSSPQAQRSWRSDSLHREITYTEKIKKTKQKTNKNPVTIFHEKLKPKIKRNPLKFCVPPSTLLDLYGQEGG